MIAMNTSKSTGTMKMETKMNGKKVANLMNRLHVAMPEPRDDKVSDKMNG